ncbi:MAG: hypothetical protein KUG77_17655 [Nannocystaceae bacterium]|nr:hypothetical protein [Nannocystaceae bacterium]
MALPYHEQEFESRSTPVDFVGCSLHSNSRIDISTGGLGWQGFASYPLTHTYSSTSPDFTDETGVEWYCWSKSQVIPDNKWYPMGDGHFTYVCSYDTKQGDYTYVYDEDISECEENLGITQVGPCAKDGLGLGPFVQIQTSGD